MLGCVWWLFWWLYFDDSILVAVFLAVFGGCSFGACVLVAVFGGCSFVTVFGGCFLGCVLLDVFWWLCFWCVCFGGYALYPHINIVCPDETGCLKNGVRYNPGDTWQEGCQYNCECLDTTGRYKCTERSDDTREFANSDGP